MKHETAFVYMIELETGAYYTGYTVDLRRRLDEHLNRGAGKGAKTTRSFPPVRLALAWKTPDRSTALRLEHAIKRLTRRQKEELLQNPRRLRSLCPGIVGVRLYRRDLPLKAPIGAGERSTNTLTVTPVE